MARPKKKPNYDPKELQQNLIEAISYSYNNPASNETLDHEHKQLKLLAEEFNMTPLKVRKLLVTGGEYKTETSREVQELYKQGLKIAEIQEKMRLSRASVHSYLPYSKTVYKQEEISTDAERIKLWRERQMALKEIDSQEQPWKAVAKFAGYPFHTVKGVKFRYVVRGNEIFVDRKEKSITRSTVTVK